MSAHQGNNRKAAMLLLLIVTLTAGAVAHARISVGAASEPSARIAANCSLGARKIPLSLLEIRPAPTQRTGIPGGAQVRYSVRIKRAPALVGPHAAGNASISFRIVALLPSGVSATFSPRANRGSATTLAISAAARARPGLYRIVLEARGRLLPDARHALQRARACVSLRIARPPAFTIRGTLAGSLVPGRTGTVNATITNPQRFLIEVSHLSMRIAGIRAPRGSATHPCTARDFVLGQYSGGVMLLPASRSRTLGSLLVPRAAWPRISMVDRRVNQDGCKGATLTLGFTAAAVAGRPSTRGFTGTTGMVGP